MKEIKSKMLAEFRDWFCEGYCQFYNMEGYCSCCPVKDERYWLEGAKKTKGENKQRNPIRFCDECKYFIPDKSNINDESVFLNEDRYKPPYSELCALRHELRFKVPIGYNWENGGFYRKGCEDFTI
mgnify:CR=1 FL=1|jgi:hypothetical protein